eukprot:c47338_g1_i1 orf=56-526(+)
MAESSPGSPSDHFASVFFSTPTMSSVALSWQQSNSCSCTVQALASSPDMVMGSSSGLTNDLPGFAARGGSLETMGPISASSLPAQQECCSLGESRIIVDDYMLAELMDLDALVGEQLAEPWLGGAGSELGFPFNLSTPLSAVRTTPLHFPYFGHSN